MLMQALRRVIKRLRYPPEVMLTCVRWYAACPLSLRHIKDDGRARRSRRSRHGASLGHQNSANARCGVSLAQTSGGHELTYGRNLHLGRRPLEIPVPGSRL